MLNIKIGGLASRPWLIVPVCIAMHMTFAVALLMEPSVANITPLSLIFELFGSFTWLVLTVASLSAAMPMLVPLPSLYTHLYLWPQQFILFLSSVSIMQAIYDGKYFDNTIPHARLFILADQCVIVYLMLAHFAAVIRNARLARSE